MQENSRIKWIDTARGIGIVLVVLGHSSNDYLPLGKFILSFHMPLFFFLSGCLALKEANKSFKEFIIKKARSLLMPQFVLGCGMFARDVVRGMGGGIHNFLMWFLIVLFYTEILFYFLSKVKILKNKYSYVACLLVCLIMIYILNGISTSTKLEIIPASLFFYILGYLLNKKILSVYYNHQSVMTQSLLLCLPVVCLCSYYNNPVWMYINSYGNPILFITGACFGIFIVITMALSINSSSIFLYYGRNSIIIYITHFFIVDIVKFIIHRILKFETIVYPFYCPIFFITILVMPLIIEICNKYFPFLFGKTTMK